MKIRGLICIIALLAMFSCEQDETYVPTFYDCSFDFADSSAFNPNTFQYQSVIDNMTAQGVPGVIMCVAKPGESTWVGASGMADLKSGVELQPCNITRVGSTVKTFTSVTILQLAEQGKLDLDDLASDYLSADEIKDIENADIATIRQLMNHSSGIFNYIQDLKFQTASLNDLIREWQPEELLQYARHKKAYFAPGEDVSYSNTNYILLGDIIETITGKPFWQVFQENIFTPLNLSETVFAATDPVPDGIIRGYVDLYSNLDVINATYYSGWDYYSADGGLISNPHDLFTFLKSVMDKQIINAESYSEMTSWTAPKEPDPDFFPIYYGLGIFKMETPYGPAYFHSGDAIGYYAIMLYLADYDTYISWAVNGNYGKIDEFTQTQEAITAVLEGVMGAASH
jgi:D-alanyl-D-alanine carboxypeptidase